MYYSSHYRSSCTGTVSVFITLAVRRASPRRYFVSICACFFPRYGVCSGEKNIYYCVFVFAETELWSKPSRTLYNPPLHIKCALTHSINFQLHIGGRGEPFFPVTLLDNISFRNIKYWHLGIFSPNQNTFNNV